MERDFQKCKEDVERRDRKLLPYEQRLAHTAPHDSTEVLDDDRDLAPIDVKKNLDPRSPAYY